MTHPPASNPQTKDSALEAAGRALQQAEPVVALATIAPGALRHPVKHGKLYRRLRRANVAKPGLVLREAHKRHLQVALVVGLLEQETGIRQRNVFGCDWGSTSGPPWCNQTVTNDRVRAMQRSGKANGVGWTQLTWPPLVVRAMNMRGGAVRPRNQMRVGLDLLRDDIQGAGSVWGGLRAYNGSDAYANEVLARYHNWHRRLTS